jgi:hypothetical protein
MAEIARTMTRLLLLSVLTSSITVRVIRSKNVALAKADWCTIRAFPSTLANWIAAPFRFERTHSLRLMTVSQEDQEDGKDRL